MKLVVGLGNPGKEYEQTYHNVGFQVVDNYLGDIKWQKEKDCLLYKETIDNNSVLFIKPTTYMNLSGKAVSRIVNFYKIDINDILVIHDDLDLKKGSYKLKVNSSSGGHNGIKSIISELGSNNFARLKVGIGHDELLTAADYVLSKMPKKEFSELQPVFNDIIDCYLTKGIDVTMNLYNFNK